jgi:hypothetical protein
MPINSSGPIALGSGSVGQSINLELGKAINATISMNDSNVRTLAGIPTGPIAFNNFYGKSNAASPSPTPSRTPTPTPTPSRSPTPTPTPTMTVTPTPSSSPPPLPTYRLYNVTYCTGGTGQVLSSGLLIADSTEVYKVDGVSLSNCFVVDSIDSFTTGTPTTYVSTGVNGCFDGGCVQI